jgi:hypothetical protein
MDYNDINNYLQNLELSQKDTEKKFQEKLNIDNCNMFNKEELLKDNKNQDLLLQRELTLDNNVKFNFQIANPQRFAEKSETKLKNNNKINDYTFNNNITYRTEYNIDNRLNNLNLNSRKINENMNKINDNLNNRELIPTKANFNLNFDN